MSDNLVGKLVKELQKLALPTASEPPPAKLSRAGNFDRWVSRMEDYLRGIDASGHGSAILTQLDDDVYDLARAAGISSSMPGTEILKNLRGILCGTTPSWLERSEFRRRTQEPPEGVLESHQALRLLGRRAYPTMKAADMEQMLLDQFVHGVSDPEVRKALLRAQPSTLGAALQLAQQEEALQAACFVRPLDLFRVTSVRPSLTVDAGTQIPWRPCSCGSFSPRQGNWRRQPPRRPNGPQNRRPVQSIDVGPQDNGDTTLDALAGDIMFWTLDLASGYWQVEVRPADREKTAFAIPSGLYEFEAMPFGLSNASSTFQRLMNQVLAQLIPTSCLVYMNDIIVLGKDFYSHLNNTRAVFSSLPQAGLTLKPSKCVFLKPRVKFLGHVFSAAGIETDDEKVTQIREWPTPADVTEVRSFLGLASYYRRFIKDYARIAGSPHKLTQKDVKFKWTADCTTSFQTLKDKLCSTPILVFPDISNDAGKFILDTDASDTAIGAVLSQQQSDGTERVIQYLSRSLTKAERRYCVTPKEMLALTHFVEECRPYLQYRPFIVRTDHSALTWLRNFKNAEGQVARWQEKLAEYDFECVFRPGRQHGNADALSRKPHRRHGECPSCTDITISAIALQSDQCLLWAAAQRDDPHICPIYDRKVSNARPLSKAELAGHSYETRCLHSLWDKLFIENGVLFYRENEQYPKRVVLPLSMVDDVVERMHAELGHSGIHKTEWALRRRYYWPNQKTDIQNVVRSCGHCLGFKSPGHSYRAPLQPIKTGYPNERVAVDLVGPIAPSARGNRFILVMVDCFTKMAEAVTLPDASAPTVARAIFNGWICRWGAPDQLHSDRGSSFESSVVHELCKVLKIKKTRTTAYHPQGNGQVERTNRTLINLLRAFVDGNSASTWDEALPACMLAYRSTVNATTQHTPFFLTCGREMQLPEDLHLPPIHPVENVDTYASRMKKALRIASEEARLHLQEGQRRQKAFYDPLAHGTPYKEGDIVLMRNFAPSPGVPQKFNPAWIGPYVPGPSTEEDTDLTDSGASSSHAYKDQPVERYLEVPSEGGYASAEVFRDGHPVEKTVEVPPDGGPAIALDDSAEDSRPFSKGGAM
ncbi:hypothetical protein SprV_0200674900 [Sparganum proliferum]